MPGAGDTASQSGLSTAAIAAVGVHCSTPNTSFLAINQRSAPCTTHLHIQMNTILPSCNLEEGTCGTHLHSSFRATRQHGAQLPH